MGALQILAAVGICLRSFPQVWLQYTLETVDDNAAQPQRGF